MKCCEVVNHSKVLLEEKKTKVVFLNEDRMEFEKHKVDDCLIKDGIKCDWAVRDRSGSTVFVELKGKDVAHACDQLFATVAHDNCAHLKGKSIGFLVVSFAKPKFDTSVIRAKNKAMREFGCGFHRVPSGKELYLTEICKINGKP